MSVAWETVRAQLLKVGVFRPFSSDGQCSAWGRGWMGLWGWGGSKGLVPEFQEPRRGRKPGRGEGLIGECVDFPLILCCTERATSTQITKPVWLSVPRVTSQSSGREGQGRKWGESPEPKDSTILLFSSPSLPVPSKTQFLNLPGILHLCWLPMSYLLLRLRVQALSNEPGQLPCVHLLNDFRTFGAVTPLLFFQMFFVLLCLFCFYVGNVILVGNRKKVETNTDTLFVVFHWKVLTSLSFGARFLGY